MILNFTRKETHTVTTRSRCFSRRGRSRFARRRRRTRSAIALPSRRRRGQGSKRGQFDRKGPPKHWFSSESRGPKSDVSRWWVRLVPKFGNESTDGWVGRGWSQSAAKNKKDIVRLADEERAICEATIEKETGKQQLTLGYLRTISRPLRDPS